LTNITSGGGVVSNTQNYNSNPRSSENGATPRNVVVDTGNKVVVNTTGGVSVKDLK